MVNTCTPQLPEYESGLVLLSVADAIAKAEAGRFAEGYACLRAGLDRAHEYMQSGEPWAPVLVERWEQSIENFCRVYRLAA